MSTSFEQLVKSGKLAVGDGYRAKNDELGGDGAIFLRSAYLQDHGWILEEPDRFKTLDTAQFREKVARLHDTVITTKGNSLGRLGIATAEVAGGVYSPHLSYWRSLDLEIVDPKWLYYWSYSALCRSQIAAAAYSTDMAPYLSLRDQLRIRIVLPPIGEQSAAAGLLSYLDEKIELNRRMARTLEDMARALFRSWFVDFDPVRAKMEGRDPALPVDAADLFPGRFGDDDMPHGWELTPLSSMARFLNGLALQKFPPSPGAPSLPVIKIAEMRAGIKPNSGRASVDLPSADYIVEDGDHLFSWSGSLTQCLWSHGRGALNQHLFKVIPKGRPAWLLYFAVDHFLPEFQAIASDKAVTMGHIQRRHLDEAVLALPGPGTLEALDRVMMPLFERLTTLPLEIRTLARLRDTLLPKLISGELRLPDAEALVEEAA